MRINGIDGVDRINAISAYKGSKVTKTGNGAVRLDESDISGEAVSFSKALSKIRESAGTLSDAETSRIKSVADSIEHGTYNVSAAEVAERMLAGFPAAPEE